MMVLVPDNTPALQELAATIDSVANIRSLVERADDEHSELLKLVTEYATACDCDLDDVDGDCDLCVRAREILERNGWDV